MRSVPSRPHLRQSVKTVGIDHVWFICNLADEFTLWHLVQSTDTRRSDGRSD